ncbi:FAD-binding dehydrogenase [Microbacterium betulae]|uniref:FAD-binding dehydrogenase n=1 Tax=Microbacterium betulae TaxID=2981139 RepID=A0AA97FDT5_9MICO|nr:FAD-binding dehydrogenase [Microbacterium sp. AB]WOF21651.1 FAD-binding dehydrogenase [Microbacterium sp. AB]
MSAAAPGAGEADAIVVGAGLAGLVAASELVDAGKRVLIVEQEPETGFGGQAWWSFGGIFLVDSPEQRRMGVRDSLELARQDWLGSAGFDRDEDRWPRQWAQAYLEFAAGEKRAWLRERGIGFFPIVGWAERGGDRASSHGNSVPRFHVTWGTGPGVLEPFVRRVREGVERGLVRVLFRHRVDRIDVEAGTVVGVSGAVLAADPAERGAPSNRDVVGDFSLRASAVLVASGGIGGNHDLVREQWPTRMGEPPASMLSGVPAHVDGRMLGIARGAGAHLINGDRMWHYVEGIRNHSPVWPMHGIRILPGPSSLWLDAQGNRLPTPLFPGFDTLATLEHIVATGHDHSWFVTNQKILEKEVALSGSEQNPDFTDKDLTLLARRLGPGAPGPVETFKERGADFLVADTVDELLSKMGQASPDLLDLDRVRVEIAARDLEMTNDFGKDAQLNAIHQARRHRGDRLLRVAAPRPLTHARSGPLIAVKLHIITRKSLGGIETDLSARALRRSGEPLPGLYAAGEASGFGGGGLHGYRALEGTFLGGCIFSGRVAGRAMAAAV